MLFVIAPGGFLCIGRGRLFDEHFSTVNYDPGVWVPLKRPGKFFLISSLLGQRSNVSLKVADKKHTQVVTMRLICDEEIENMSAKCLPIRLKTNSSSSLKTLFGAGFLLSDV